MPRGKGDACEGIMDCHHCCFGLTEELDEEGTEVFPPSGDEGAELGEQGLRMKLPPLVAKCLLVGNPEEELEVSGLPLVQGNQSVQGGQVGLERGAPGRCRGRDHRGRRRQWSWGGWLLLLIKLFGVFMQRSRGEQAREAGQRRGEEAGQKRLGHGHQE